MGWQPIGLLGTPRSSDGQPPTYLRAFTHRTVISDGRLLVWSPNSGAIRLARMDTECDRDPRHLDDGSGPSTLVSERSILDLCIPTRQTARRPHRRHVSVNP